MKLAWAVFLLGLVDAGALTEPEEGGRAINKVIDMLEDLKAEVSKAGDAEAKTYDKFACFCKDMTAEKTESITTCEDEIKTLEAEIGELTTKRQDLDDTIKDILEVIDKAEETMKTATKERKEAKAEYEKADEELTSAIDALKGAIKVLKASKESLSLSQLQAVAKTVRAATLMADAMGLTSEKDKVVLGFLQGEHREPEVPEKDYDYHMSDKVIDMLEKLLTDFKQQKDDADKAEASAVEDYNALMDEKKEVVKKKEEEHEEAKKEKGTVTEELATASENLTGFNAQLLDDKQYMTRLSAVCHDKAVTWDQRSKSRADEISAISAALEIIKGTVKEKAKDVGMKLAQQGIAVHIASEVVRSDTAMRAIEAETEAKYGGAIASESAPSFLSLREHVTRLLKPTEEASSRKYIIQYLKAAGTRLKSQLLISLSGKIADDPFKKVKTLIQELIERMLKEAGEEATQKGWCDKSTADAKAKRARAEKAIVEANSAMAKAEAERDGLVESIKVLEKDIGELEDALAKAKKMRAEEKAENEKDIADSKEGLEAITEALNILKTYYAEAAKSTVLLQGVDDDLPDAGFKSGEAYKGSDSGTGVIGMLEVIQSDFARTIEETEKAEKAAQEDFVTLERTTSKSLSAKKTQLTNAKTTLDNLEEHLTGLNEELGLKADMLNEAIKELLELKPACVDTAMSYEERVEMRNNEIASLKQALCILDNFAKYGPNAEGDAC